MAEKKKANLALKAKWANDPEYRKRMTEVFTRLRKTPEFEAARVRAKQRFFREHPEFLERKVVEMHQKQGLIPITDVELIHPSGFPRFRGSKGLSALVAKNLTALLATRNPKKSRSDFNFDTEEAAARHVRNLLLVCGHCYGWLLIRYYADGSCRVGIEKVPAADVEGAIAMFLEKQKKLKKQEQLKKSRCLELTPPRWRITAPNGSVYEVRSLKRWARNNRALLKKTVPYDANVVHHFYMGIKKTRKWRGWKGDALFVITQKRDTDAAVAKDPKPKSESESESKSAPAYVLVAPNGCLFEFQNLRKWCLDNEALILKLTTDANATLPCKRPLYLRMYTGLWLSGALHWYGWRLQRLPLPIHDCSKTPIMPAVTAPTPEPGMGPEMEPASDRRRVPSLPILEFIAMIRDSFVGAEHVYMNGSCYYFAKTLQALYGGALHETVDHVYLCLDGTYYDIRGKVRPVGDPQLAEEPTPHGKFDMLKQLNICAQTQPQSERGRDMEAAFTRALEHLYKLCDRKGLSRGVKESAAVFAEAVASLAENDQNLAGALKLIHRLTRWYGRPMSAIRDAESFLRIMDKERSKDEG